MRSNRSRAVALTIIAVLVVSACQNLPRRAAGGRCKLAGEHAQDGTWVLRCEANKRWKRIMTIDQANQAVGNWLRSLAPQTGSGADTPTVTNPPSVVTPPPAPSPDVRFGASDVFRTVGEATGQIKPGTYATTVPTGAECAIIDPGPTSASPYDASRFGAGGTLYIDLAAGQVIAIGGPCTWNLGLPNAQPIPANGDGMYRVGIEIQPGVYTAPGAAQCYWELATDATGSLASVTDIYYGKGPQLVIVEPTDTYFDSDGCGPWTAMPTPPARYLQVTSAPTNVAWQGLRAFYTGNQFTVTSDATTTNITNSDVGIYLRGVQNGPLTEGTFDAKRFPNTFDLTLDITGSNRACNSVEGTVVIEDLVTDGSGVPTSMHVLAIATCDGVGFAFNLQI